MWDEALVIAIVKVRKHIYIDLGGYKASSPILLSAFLRLVTRFVSVGVCSGCNGGLTAGQQQLY